LWRKRKRQEFLFTIMPSADMCIALYFAALSCRVILKQGRTFAFPLLLQALLLLPFWSLQAAFFALLLCHCEIVFLPFSLSLRASLVR